MASYQVQTVLRRLGEDIKTARKRRRLSVADFCERIGVTDKTLARLERGDGGVRLELFAAALLALGELHRLEALLDPQQDETGLLLDRERLPDRIRRQSRKSPVADPPDGSGTAPDEDSEGTAF